MAITPQTEIRLLKVPFEIDNKNQLTFSNLSSQTNYFLSLDCIEIENCRYQRKDNILYFPAHIDSILEYNYVMYKNANYSNKWFYAFITDKKYNNDGLTDITIKTDVFQTWQFDLVYKRMFVEREHVSDDTIGLHTVPENLETGEYVNNGEIQILDNFQSWAYIVNVTSSADGDPLIPTVIGGIVSAGGFYVFNGASSSDVIAFINFIQSYDARPDAIVNVYIVPFALVEGTYNTESHKMNLANVKTFTKSLSKPSSLNGYTPKNHKLLTYPFCYLIMSNGNGSSNIFHYEKFSTNNASFEIKGLPTTGSSIKAYPKNYKGAIYEEGLIAGKFPTCSWGNDQFINWLTQNAVNLGIGVASSGAQLIGGLSAGGLNPTTISGLSGIANVLSQVYQHSFIPPSAQGNTNGGDVLTSSGLNTFLFYPMSIKEEYAKIIDNFFNMYGYKINDVKIPNINGRLHWNYVKTIEANILGEIPQEDLQEIKDIFNNGVTFWHNTNTFLDYSQNNVIV